MKKYLLFFIIGFATLTLSARISLAQSVPTVAPSAADDWTQFNLTYPDPADISSYSCDGMGDGNGFATMLFYPNGHPATPGNVNYEGCGLLNNGSPYVLNINTAWNGGAWGLDNPPYSNYTVVILGNGGQDYSGYATGFSTSTLSGLEAESQTVNGGSPDPDFFVSPPFTFEPPAYGIIFSCDQLAITTNGVMNCHASLNGTPIYNNTFTFSATEGTLTDSGDGMHAQYMAPSFDTVDYLTAVSNQSTTISSTIAIDVNDTGAVQIGDVTGGGTAILSQVGGYFAQSLWGILPPVGWYSIVLGLLLLSVGWLIYWFSGGTRSEQPTNNDNNILKK